jgi:hypothetical protein
MSSARFAPFQKRRPSHMRERVGASRMVRIQPPGLPSSSHLNAMSRRAASVDSVRERSSARSRLRQAPANSLRAACCRASAVNSADSRFRCARSVATVMSCRAPRISKITAVAAPIHFTMRADVDEEDGSASRRRRACMSVTMLAPALSFNVADHTFRSAHSELKSLAFRGDTRTCVDHRCVISRGRHEPQSRD